MAKKRQSIHKTLKEYFKVEKAGEGDIGITVYKREEEIGTFFFSEEVANQIRKDIKKEIIKSKEMR